MKKYFGILMILALIAAPAFATPEESGTVTVTVNVSQYAEIDIQESVTLNTGTSTRTHSSTGDTSPYGLTRPTFTVLANFPYDLVMTSDVSYDGSYAAAVWDEEQGEVPAFFSYGENDGPMVAYIASILNMSDQAISHPVHRPGGIDGAMVSWNTISGLGSVGDTISFKLAAALTTLTSKSGFGSAIPGDLDEPKYEAWLAGEYTGELTLTVVAAAEN